MNITEYVKKDFDASLYYGWMSIKGGYTIANANEAVYRYVGNNSARSIMHIIHPDDVEEFKAALEKLDDEPQHMFLRILCFDKEYRVMYTVVSYNGRIVDGFRSFDMELCEVMRSFERLDHNAGLVKKYRSIMSYSENYYFDYDCLTGEFTLFNYVNGMYNNIIKKKPLEELEKETVARTDLDEMKLAQFKLFCESLKKNINNIDLELDGAVFDMDDRNLRFYGGFVIDNKRQSLISGVVSAYDKKDGRQSTEKYYMSSAAIDKATGVYNKRAIEEIAKLSLLENKDRVYIAIFDIDDFKLFNDTYGHMMGDKIIEGLAKISKDVVANRGYVGRFGGDEFVIVTDKVKTEEEFIYVLKTIRKNLDWRFREQFGEAKLTVSIGIAMSPKDGTMYEELFEKADKSLYLAKEKGKNRFIIYDERSERIHTGDSHKSGFRLSDDQYQIANTLLDMLLVIKKDQSKIESVLANMVKDYDVDYAFIYDMREGFPIYVNEDLVVRPPRLTSEILSEVESLGDKNGFFTTNRLANIQDNYPNMYKFFDGIGSNGFVFQKMKKRLFIIGFNQKLRKWSNYDKGLLSVFSRAIDDILG
ncbi:MAG TPA: hypothetical protein DEO82_01185 [Eubacterium sp.]|nr:hypothetical protein [Eubacterium sp.]